MMQRIFFFFIGLIIGLILGQSEEQRQVQHAPSAPRPVPPATPAQKPVQPPTASPAPAADTLTDIKGIGPSFAKALNDAGILTFAQLAQRTAEEIASMVPRATVERIQREDWIGQAKSQANRTN